MTILSRYILREFIRVFAMSIAACAAIYLVVDFFEHMEMMIRAQASVDAAVLYFFLKLPFILYQAIPAAVLLATLLTAGLMSRTHEITAMKSAGIDPVRQMRVLFAAAAVLGAVMFLLNEWIVPAANREAEMTRRVRIKKEKILPAFKAEGVWFREDRVFYHVGMFHPVEKRLQDIMRMEMGEGFSPAAITTADRAAWNGTQWVLESVRTRVFSAGRPAGYEERPSLPVSLPYSVEDFSGAMKKPEEMNIRELSEYLSRLERSGSPVRAWIPDLHMKISFPAVTLIMVVLGLPLAVRGGGRTASSGASGLALIVGLAFALGFSYWIVLAFSVSLGRSGTLPAWLSAWLPNILFGFAGAFLLRRTPR